MYTCMKCDAYNNRVLYIVPNQQKKNKQKNPKRTRGKEIEAHAETGLPWTWPRILSTHTFSGYSFSVVYLTHAQHMCVYVFMYIFLHKLHATAHLSIENMCIALKYCAFVPCVNYVDVCMFFIILLVFFRCFLFDARPKNQTVFRFLHSLHVGCLFVFNIVCIILAIHCVL